ncbi:hypothetical protein ASG42_27215 [Rhizobium sp. Leaf391]|nr:hypothetical protein ASG42_27215 [Rhizobium sp. Leaf391]
MDRDRTGGLATLLLGHILVALLMLAIRRAFTRIVTFCEQRRASLSKREAKQIIISTVASIARNHLPTATSAIDTRQI